MSLASGHQGVPLEGEELAKQEKDFMGNRNGVVRLIPDRWIFTASFMKFADNLYNFKVLNLQYY